MLHAYVRIFDVMGTIENFLETKDPVASLSRSAVLASGDVQYFCGTDWKAGQACPFWVVGPPGGSSSVVYKKG